MTMGEFSLHIPIFMFAWQISFDIISNQVVLKKYTHTRILNYLLINKDWWNDYFYANTFAINWHMYLHTEKTIANLLPHLYHIHIIFAIAANFLYSYTDVSTLTITCLAEKRDFLFFHSTKVKDGKNSVLKSCR